jgi:hypothetical protein
MNTLLLLAALSSQITFRHDPRRRYVHDYPTGFTH